MLLGLAVKYLSPNHEEPVMDHVCGCVGLNSTPHILTVNATSHVHCYRRVGKVNQGCLLVSAPHMVNMTFASNAHDKSESFIWISAAGCDTTKAL